jgi:hypothetical protein
MAGKPIFTYLLGAGASCNVLPLVKDFPERLDQFLDYIKTSFHLWFRLDEDIEYNVHDPKGQLIKDLESLIVEVKKHASIDTYAKKLYLIKSYEPLLKLKSLITLYLTFEQFKNGIDKRYDAFFAALLEPEEYIVRIPDNVKIITWNYDFQLDHSLCNFMLIKDSKELNDSIHIYPGSAHNGLNSKRFSIIKINGTVLGNISQGKEFHNSGFNPTLSSDLFLTNQTKDQLSLFNNYFRTVSSYTPYGQIEPSILYSWEVDDIAIEARKHATRIMERTDYLIVIGYSFPTFNRAVDRDLLSQLKDSTKVYIQTPTKGINSVIQRFNALSNRIFDIQRIEETDEFFIPFEFR